MFKKMYQKLLSLALNKLIKLWFAHTKKDPDGSIAETISELISQDHDEGHSIDSDERILLGNVLDLKDTPIDEIKIARAEIVALPDTASVDEVLTLMLEKKMSQLIIYKGELDNVIGYITLEDITRCHKNTTCAFKLENFIQPIDFVSPSMRTLDLLLNLREHGKKMAIIVNEYGGVEGLVTFKDLIEEIVGDIKDIDTINPPGDLLVKDDGDIIVDGHTKLKDINEGLGIVLQRSSETDEDITTIGGLLSTVAGRVPARGEVIQYRDGIEFLILDATPRKVRRVCIKNLQLPTDSSLQA